MEAQSQASSSSHRYRLPICRCGSTMRHYVSGSDANPKRPYWKCANWTKEYGCKLWVWEDQISEKHFSFREVVASSIETVGATIGVVSSQTQSCKRCENGDKLMEAVMKENEKLKAKLVKERARVKGITSRVLWLEIGLFMLMCIFVVYVVITHWK